jgi:hypothetical protein
MAKQPNVVREANAGRPNDDPQYREDNREFFYTSKNPLGPYQRYRERPYGNQGQQYIEGLSTQKNMDQWSNYAARNSGPKIAPGTGNKRGR